MVTRAKNLEQDLAKTWGGIIQDIDARMKKGEDVPHCLARTLLEIGEEEHLDALDMSTLCGAFMIGGVETVSLRIPTWYTEFNRSFRLLPSCNGSQHYFLPTHLSSLL